MAQLVTMAQLLQWLNGSTITIAQLACEEELQDPESLTNRLRDFNEIEGQLKTNVNDNQSLSGLPTKVFKLEFESTGVNLSQLSTNLGSS